MVQTSSRYPTESSIQSNLRRVASAFAATTDPRSGPSSSSSASRAGGGRGDDDDDDARLRLRLGAVPERQAALRALSDALYRAWAQATRARACALCAEERPAARFRRATPLCAHPPRACAGCLRRWAAAQLDGGAWSRLRCPECEQALRREDVKAVAGSETYER
jgi:hypothetical protein